MIYQTHYHLSQKTMTCHGIHANVTYGILYLLILSSNAVFQLTLIPCFVRLSSEAPEKY